MNNFNLISTNVSTRTITVSSNTFSGLLCSPAISFEVSFLTVFPRGRSEAFFVVVWYVTLHLHAVVSYFCTVVSILLRLLF
jgi:hypothetical protein